MARIRDIAQICKSKNAGPFMVTIDVLFEDHELYRQVKATGVLRQRCPGWCRPAISATPMCMGRNSMRRCWTWTSQ
jgi:hypothetical protein